MSERSRSFNVEYKNYDEIQKILENILKEDFLFSTEPKRLGNSLFRINYFDKDAGAENQKENRITILQESDKRVYIQIKGKMLDAQVDDLWNIFEMKLYNSTFISKFEKKKTIKDDIIQKIKSLIDIKGYIVKNEEVETFIDNFIEKYKRLPEKNEFQTIVKGYMIMINENYLLNKSEDLTKIESYLEKKDSVLDIIEDDKTSISKYKTANVSENGIGRRKCPSCGDEGSIHEITDKNVIILDYPRIFGKKKYCGKCGFEWK
ncbi:MAG: hypothetical protein ACFFCM_15135 [Promethearchaeota archaeon]